MASSSSRKPRMGSKSNIMFTNAVYYPSYAIYTQDTPGQLNYSCISLVYYAFAKVTSEGHVFVSRHNPFQSRGGGRGRPLYIGSPDPNLTRLTPAQLSDEWADAGAPCDGVQGALGSLMHRKQEHPHLQVVLSIGGTESATVFPSVAADPIRRDNFARSALGLVDASGLDGIDSTSFVFCLLSFCSCSCSIPPLFLALLI